MTYDPAYPRLSKMRTTPGHDGAGFSDTDYTYVPVGTPGAGHRATVDGPLASDGVSYGYDALGRLHTRSLGGVTTTWNYDALGRLLTEVDPIGTFTFAYDGVSGRLQQLTYPNGQTSSYLYFGNTGEQRLQEIHHKTGSGTTLSRFAYAYSAAGNITTWTQQYGAAVKAHDFTYDATDQLTGAVYRTMDATPVVQKRYGYVYDRAGNRTEARVDDTPVTAAYNRLNQLTSHAAGTLDFIGTTNEPAAVTVAGQPATSTGASAFRRTVALPTGTSTVAVTATDASGNTRARSYEVDVAASPETFTYDANGNLTARGTKTYEWDAENQLTRVLDSGTEIARFVYDGFGRRVQKISGGITRSYVYDGMDILQERVGTSTTRTVHGPGIDHLLASIDPAGTVSYYLSDHLGSIVQQTNAAGAVTLMRQYDPYGVPLEGAATSGYAFTGREWDSETGLYYYRARYYDANLGRFISEDPIGMAGGVNLMAYANGQPTGSVDPSGLVVMVRSHLLDSLGWLAPLDYGPPPADPVERAIWKFWVQLDLTSQLMPAGAVLKGPQAAVRFCKAVNLPPWRRVVIQMEHVLSGHTKGGIRAIQSGLKDLFPDAMNPKAIERSIREAYRYGTKMGDKGGRLLIEGTTDTGLTIQMYFNKATKIIESAWPKW